MKANQPSLDAFQVIADPGRRQMIRLLSEQPLTINGLADHFEMSRPAVSKHVKVLWEAGFIAIEDRGRERYCSLCPDGFRLIQEWIVFYDRFWQNKLQNLAHLLNEPSKL